MTKLKENMQKLIERRDQLLREMEAIRNRIAELENAIQLVSGEAPTPTSHPVPLENGRRSNVKTAVLDLLREVGTTGLNAHTAVEIAGRKGVSLDRGSVSSLLSRLKKEGTVEYDRDRYRLTEFGSALDSQSTNNMFN